MMTRTHGHLVFECDACGEVLETGKTDFVEALGVLRAANWVSRKTGDDWDHRCDECADARK